MTSLYSILNTRKRAVIALIHTIVFFLVALLTLHRMPSSPTARAVMTGVYTVVSLVLLILVGYARALAERFYFALCTSSALIGLLRFTVHHPAVTAAQVLRPAALGCAAIVVTAIARSHSERRLEPAA